VQLALFDLDNTLLDGDSDLEWGELLAADGAADLERMRAFHADYHAGTLDIDLFLRFQLEPLAREPMPRLLAWRERFLAERILPRIPRRSHELVAEHRAAGHTLILITASNDFLTRPIADALGIEHLIATRAEQRGGLFTGRVHGRPCFREGKVARLAEWLEQQHCVMSDVRESWFYSDSHNDLPLLRLVDHPIAVEPDERLRAVAARERWRILERESRG
jgi:HAD superfamily hydrolase (TIGR01490 family)